MTPYIISYFTVGLFLGVGALSNGVFAHEKRLIATFATVLLWPLLALVTPETFFRNTRDASHVPDPLKLALEKLEKSSEELPLSREEAGHLRIVADQGEPGVAYFGASAVCRDVLNAFWDADIPPAVYHELGAARRALEEPKPDSGIRFSLRAPDWYIGFSNEFVKSIAKIDRKLQGRILEAISKIGDAPTTFVGDTIKPLTGDLAGLWRCRVGDDRLVYFPHHLLQRITLICFGPRGKVYTDLPDTATLTMRSNGPPGRGHK